MLLSIYCFAHYQLYHCPFNMLKNHFLYIKPFLYHHKSVISFALVKLTNSNKKISYSPPHWQVLGQCDLCAALLLLDHWWPLPLLSASVSLHYGKLSIIIQFYISVCKNVHLFSLFCLTSLQMMSFLLLYIIIYSTHTVTYLRCICAVCSYVDSIQWLDIQIRTI